MKRSIILIILYLLSLQLQSQPTFASIDYGRLGNFIGFGEIFILGADEYGLEWFQSMYFQNGEIIKWYHGGRITTIVGYNVDGDLGWTKNAVQAINNEAVNSEEDVHVYVYEANDIENPIPIQHKIAKGDIGSKLQSLNLNLDRGRLYILVFYDVKGAVLEVKKVILAD